PGRADSADLQSSFDEFHSYQTALGARKRTRKMGKSRASDAAQRLRAIPPYGRTGDRCGRCLRHFAIGCDQPAMVDGSLEQSGNRPEVASGTVGVAPGF